MLEASTPFDLDRLHMLPLSGIADATMATLHPIQTLSPEEQMAGAAVLFATVCKRVGVSGQDMWEFAERVLTYPPKPEDRVAQNTMRAIRDFAGLRIKGDERVTV